MSSPGASTPQGESASHRLSDRTSRPRNAPSWCQFVLVSVGTRRSVHLFADRAGRSPKYASMSAATPVSSTSSISSNSMRGESAVHSPPLARTHPRRRQANCPALGGVNGAYQGGAACEPDASHSSNAARARSMPRASASARSGGWCARPACRRTACTWAAAPTRAGCAARWPRRAGTPAPWSRAA